MPEMWTVKLDSKAFMSSSGAVQKCIYGRNVQIHFCSKLVT